MTLTSSRRSGRASCRPSSNWRSQNWDRRTKYSLRTSNESSSVSSLHARSVKMTRSVWVDQNLTTSQKTSRPDQNHPRKCLRLPDEVKDLNQGQMVKNLQVCQLLFWKWCQVRNSLCNLLILIKFKQHYKHYKCLQVFMLFQILSQSCWDYWDQSLQ